MASYTTLDNLRDLTASQMSGAGELTFEPFLSSEVLGWDNRTVVSGHERNAILHSIYSFNAKEGATYNIISNSEFDPLTRIYDSQGNAIFKNIESDDPGGSSADIILGWIAPYTGTYYIDAGWQQNILSSRSSYSLSINEDVDTAISTDNTTSTAEPFLAMLGVTIQQAKDFIFSHANEPTTIFNVAKQYGLSTTKLSEITGFSTSDVSAYFSSFGLDAEKLNKVNSSSGTRDLLAPDLTSFASIIAFNNNTGVLSTKALRESANVFSSLPKDVFEEIYYLKFNPSNFKGAGDGIFTPEELGGITSLGNIPATVETLESLFYGTAINAYRNYDLNEFLDIGANIATAREIEINAYTSPTSDPFNENNEDLAAFITGASLIGHRPQSEISFFDNILQFG